METLTEMVAEMRIKKKAPPIPDYLPLKTRAEIEEFDNCSDKTFSDLVCQFFFLFFLLVVTQFGYKWYIFNRFSHCLLIFVV